MRRFISTIVFAAMGTTMAGVGIALAGDVRVSPDAPPEGEAELTIEISGFEPDTPVYAVPCEVPATGEVVDVTNDSCDIAEVATATTDGAGNATMVVDWLVPADGIAVYVSDEARAHEATQIVAPEAEVVTASVPDEDDPDVAVLGTNVVQEDLADTGPREVMILTMFATLAIALGVALRGAERLLTPA